MRVSLSWLKEYVSIRMAPERLAEALTMAGLEVEAYWDPYAYLERVLVGRVAAVRPHPNADNLRLADVDTANRQVTVVCGAPNLAKGLLAPLALPGTQFPDGRVLEKSTIRGAVSEGMLCSQGELDLGSDFSGLMTLDAGLAVGTPLGRALQLSDTVFEIDLTPNRPDCLSLLGVAREIAAIENTHVRYPDFAIADEQPEIEKHTSVTIEAPEACNRYAARLLTDITIARSPRWLQERLLSVGLRPINNVVDITNFVLMETGQPLHAFDFDRLAENRIVVRKAGADESFVTLDGKQRQLTEEMLLICDGRQPVALAGIMGGLNSEIEPDTRRVLIESAYFNPVAVRRTAKQLGLKTDASHRFERGVDPQGIVCALNRAARLMAELGGGKPVAGLIDNHPRPHAGRTIELHVPAANRLLGTRTSRDSMAADLRRIEFDVQADDEDETLQVKVPSFRVDILRPEDLMEEVARLEGYANIPTTYPAIPAEARPVSRRLRLRSQVRSLLSGFGFAEAINYSFISPQACDRLGLAADDPRRRMVALVNPLSEEQTAMRTSLLPGLLETMRRNQARQVHSLKLFETGRLYLPDRKQELPNEMEMLAVLWTGWRRAPSWHDSPEPCDFYDIKGVIEALLEALGVRPVRFTRLPQEDQPYLDPAAAASIAADGRHLGALGAIHPRVVKSFELKQSAFVCEIDLERLLPIVPEGIQQRPLPRFPAVTRDITLIVDEAVEAQALLDCVIDLEEELIEDLQLFDVFAGDPVPQGRKSVSFRVTYRSAHQTLEDDKVNQLHRRISEHLLGQFNASLPA